MKKKTQQKQPKKAKPRKKASARKATAFLVGVGDVEIDIKDCENPYPGEYVYNVLVRAKVTLPSNDCDVEICQAEVYVDPSFPDFHEMHPEMGSPGWYTTGVFEVFGCEPGDVLSAKVTAYWVCRDSNTRAESAELPPCS